MEKKSILTPVLSVVLALVVLGTGLLAAFKGGLFGGKDKEKTEEPKTEFNFDGINNVVDYASNTIDKIEKLANGELETGVSMNLGVEFGDMMLEEMDIDSLGKITLSVDGKVKGSMAANDIAVKYDDSAIISAKTVVDGTTAYFCVPELSDAYVKGDFAEVLKNELSTSEQELSDAMNSEVADKLAEAMKAFDGEKIQEMTNTYLEIIKNNVPEGKSNGKISGDVNGITYEYTKTQYEIHQMDALNMAEGFLNEIKNDNDIKEVYNVIRDQLMTTASSETDGSEQLPEYDEMIQSALDQIAETKKSAAEEPSDDALVFDLVYNNDKVCGLVFTEEEAEMTFVCVDENDKFAIDMIIDTPEETIKMKYSIEGSDGKYTGKLLLDVGGETVSFDYSSDTQVVDEESGAFKGNITVSVTAEGQTAKLSIDSDSTADKVDFKVSASFEGEDLFVLTFDAVETKASDITVPTGTIYDIENEEDMEKYSESCDFEGFEANAKKIIGDKLYMMINEDVFGYDYEKDYENPDSLSKKDAVAPAYDDIEASYEDYIAS